MATTKNSNSTALVVAQVQACTALVAAKDYSGAARSLMVIADQEGGDKALTMALSQVPATELSIILATTATSPSLTVGTLVSPKDLVRSLVELPRHWSESDSADAKHQLNELFIGVVMRIDEDSQACKDAAKFLTAIEKSPEALKILAWWLGEHGGYLIAERLSEGQKPEESANDEEQGDDESPELVAMSYEPNLGEWDHMLWLLQKKHPAILAEVKGLWKKALSFVELLPSVSVPEAEESALGHTYVAPDSGRVPSLDMNIVHV